MARMTLYLNDAEHARLAELAERYQVSRSRFLRGLIMGDTFAVAGAASADVVAKSTSPQPVTRTPGLVPSPPVLHGGEFSKDDQVGKKKR